ncbi:MAG: thioredoxin domain-containing protein [Acidimicrobiales bacterium]|nr:thioredoxin domain-containing protein [Acidimicrobiales bacterium]
MNQLHLAISPYLLQHADNPVEWHLWGQEALLEAEERDVPVLISIGYSACHWCHVMAHESFEDHGTANLMNQYFVNIKIDREEYPQVDALYMEAALAMNGHGGWPLTIFALPDGSPFYAGTYYPNRPRGGMPSFIQVIGAIHSAWENKKEELFKEARVLGEAIARRTQIPEMLSLNSELGAQESETGIKDDIYKTLSNRFASQVDSTYGGFGNGPKFPMALQVELCLRIGSTSADSTVLNFGLHALDAMSSGGLFDHINGGFFRYCVDETWSVPHFEKMLYDQAMLLPIYLHGYLLTGQEKYLYVIEETISFVTEKLFLESGGIAASLDADTNGVEGATYTWREDEVKVLLNDPDLISLVCQFWSISKKGNFEKTNVLRRPNTDPLFPIPEEILLAKDKMKAAVSQRPQPGIDDKSILEWNAMWISALCQCSISLGNKTWSDLACKTGKFVLDNLRDKSGKWLRATRGGTLSQAVATSADIAWLIDAMTRLYELTGEDLWLDEALKASKYLEVNYFDPVSNSLKLASLAEALLVENVNDYFDNVTPSANSTASSALLRLHQITGKLELRELAVKLIRPYSQIVNESPSAFCQLLIANDLTTNGSIEIVIPGGEGNFTQVLKEFLIPNAIILLGGDAKSTPLLTERVPGFAYICHDGTCDLPAGDEESFLSQLIALGRIKAVPRAQI